MHKMFMKSVLLASMGGALFTAQARADEAAMTPAAEAPAAEESGSWFPGSFSGTVGFTTNYMFRGQTQTQDDPAIFGSFDWSHDSGVYAGIWASTVDFYDDDAGLGTFDDDANIEVDYYVGFANSIAGLDYDVSWLYYMYPGANPENNGIPSYNYYEFAASLGHDFGPFALKASINYSPDYSGEIGQELYYNGAVSIPLPFLPFDATLDGAVGYTSIETYDNFMDWQVGLGFTVLGFGLDFRYVGCDIDATGTGNPLYTDPAAVDDEFVFTITRSL